MFSPGQELRSCSTTAPRRRRGNAAGSTADRRIPAARRDAGRIAAPARYTGSCWIRSSSWPTCTSTSAARWRRTSSGPSRTSRASSCRCRPTGSSATWSPPSPTRSSSLDDYLDDPAPLDGEDSVVAGGHRALGLRDHRQGVPLQPGVADRAALQPDEAQPGRRARPGPHHPRRAARAWTAPCLEYGVAGGADLLPGARVLASSSTRSWSRRRSSTGPAAWWASTWPGPRSTRWSWGREVDAYARPVRARARTPALGTTVHTGETPLTGARGRAGGAGAAGARRASATASPPPAARRPCASWSSAGRVLEICPSSNLRTRAVARPRRAGRIAAHVRRARACASPSTPTAPTCSTPTCGRSSSMLLDGGRPDRGRRPCAAWRPRAAPASSDEPDVDGRPPVRL